MGYLIRLAKAEGMDDQEARSWAEGVVAEDQRIMSEFKLRPNTKYAPLRDYIQELENRLDRKADQ